MTIQSGNERECVHPFFSAQLRRFLSVQLSIRSRSTRKIIFFPCTRAWPSIAKLPAEFSIDESSDRGYRRIDRVDSLGPDYYELAGKANTISGNFPSRVARAAKRRYLINRCVIITYRRAIIRGANLETRLPSTGGGAVTEEASGEYVDSFRWFVRLRLGLSR